MKLYRNIFVGYSFVSAGLMSSIPILQVKNAIETIGLSESFSAGDLKMSLYFGAAAILGALMGASVLSSESNTNNNTLATE